jgi:hypothetical protein
MMNIESLEQYEAAQSLFTLLHKLGFKAAKNAADICDGEYGDEFNRCGNCDEPRFDCSCDRDGPDYYSAYDDEASFE